MSDSFVEKGKRSRNFLIRLLVLVCLFLVLLFSVVGSHAVITDAGSSVVSGATLVLGNGISTNYMGRAHIVLVILAFFFVLYEFSNKSKDLALFLVVLSSVFFIAREYYFVYVTYGVSEYDAEMTKSLFTNVYSLAVLILTTISIVFLIILALDGKKFNVFEMTEVAVFVGLALLFDQSFMKVKIGANGGSVSFEWIPLVIIALRHGPLKGFIAAGVIYGFLSCVIGGYGIAFYPFDYFLAFGSIALIGLLPRFVLRKTTKSGFKLSTMLLLGIGLVVVTGVKLLIHTISGVIFWELDFVPSLVYNAPSNLITGSITIVLVLALSGPLTMVNARFPTASN